MSIESMMRGFGLAIKKLVQHSSQEFCLVPAMIAIYNPAAMIQSLCLITFLCGWVTQAGCAGIGVVAIATYHIMMLAFSAFLLYRTWLVTSKNGLFFALAVVAIVNRTGWALADLIISRMYWDDSYMACIGYTKSFIMAGYLFSDLSTDLLCTVTTIVASKPHLSTDLKKLFLVILSENILRSVFVLAIQCAAVWGNLTNQAYEWTNIIAAMQMYIYAQAINSEFWWVEMRSAAARMTSAATTSDGSAASDDVWATTSLMITIFIYAMSIESMMRGFGLSIKKLLQRSSKEFCFAPATIAIYNPAAMIQTLCLISFLCGWVTQAGCTGIGVVAIATYHIMMLAFSAFLLYRTWLVTSKNGSFFALAVLTLLNRAGWALADLIISKTYWDDRFMICTGSSKSFIMAGYLFSDLSTDLLCTVTTIVASKPHLSTDLKKLFLLVLSENILRSVFVLAIQCAAVWGNLTNQDYSWTNIIAATQMYIYAQAINSEFWWVEMRSAAVNVVLSNRAIREMNARHVENHNRFKLSH
ncbi:hypothetical protein HDU98_000621 [Podochytrium sp. JEL0797]|nr:hypothetical protein HDU98_000621 [Podochytrium sp. JEL0797]